MFLLARSERQACATPPVRASLATGRPRHNAFAPTPSAVAAANELPKGDYGRRSQPPSRMNFPRGADWLEFRGRARSIGWTRAGRRAEVGLRLRAGAHHVHGLGFGLGADIPLGPLAHLVALVEQLGLLHLLEGLSESRFGVLQLHFQFVRRALEVVAPLDRRLGIGRVGEMTRIMNAGAILLDLDVALEIAADALELADHGLDLGHPATPLLDVKFLQANGRLAGLHRLAPPRSPGYRVEQARPPPDASLRAAWRNGIHAALGVAQRVDILAQDSLLLSYLGGTNRAVA